MSNLKYNIQFIFICLVIAGIIYFRTSQAPTQEFSQPDLKLLLSKKLKTDDAWKEFVYPKQYIFNKNGVTINFPYQYYKEETMGFPKECDIYTTIESDNNKIMYAISFIPQRNKYPLDRDYVLNMLEHQYHSNHLIVYRLIDYNNGWIGPTKAIKISYIVDNKKLGGPSIKIDELHFFIYSGINDANTLVSIKTVKNIDALTEKELRHANSSIDSFFESIKLNGQAFLESERF